MDSLELGPRPKSTSRPQTARSASTLRTMSSKSDLYARSVSRSSAGSKHSSARSVVGEWRHDKVLAEWFSGVQERKSKVGSKVYKQAVQDANWTLERRAKQARELRERSRQEEAETARQAAAQQRSARPAVQPAPRERKRRPSMYDEPLPPQLDEPPRNALGGIISSHAHATSTPLGEHQQRPLEWQPLRLTQSARGRTKQDTVWIKPGVFITTDVVQGDGNSLVIAEDERVQ